MGHTYLVTGGAGFIGSHVASRLLDLGHRVVIADNLLTGSLENVPDGAEFVRLDLADRAQYPALDALRPRAVIHLAGQSSGEISFECPERDLDINARATLLLAAWALERGCRRFLYSSSVSVYGDGSPGRAMSESDPVAPKSFYACSKLASEHCLRVFDQTYGLRSTSLRLFNVYGPGQNMANMKQGMVSIYLGYVLFRDLLEVKGSFDRYRDFVHVDDVADLILLCLDDTRSFGRVFNVGTGRGTTVRELVGLMLAMCAKPGFPVRELPGTPGDVFGSLADISLVERVMGWAPRVGLEQGLRGMIDFYAPRAGEGDVRAG
ncbi:MAG: NAD-dependent epimerase/dehydratase family protein [Desulfovibrionaceae bacterium]|nr:NAD-dependent epimerase/dehydratase family protein [Desulfovibrionaceae bacterium]